MTRRPWNPVGKDGNIDPAEIDRPLMSTEQNTWEISDDDVGLISAALLCTCLNHPTLGPLFSQHRFIVPLVNAVVTAHWGMFPNVAILSPTIRTQSEANEVIPAILAVRAARRETVFAPTEEIGVSGLGLGIDALRVRGGEVPMQPAHVRALRDQATISNTEFSLAWGRWVPIGQMPLGSSFDGVEIKCPLGRTGGVYIKTNVLHSNCILDGEEYPE